MISTSELTDFYYKTLYPALEILESDRKSVRQRVFVVGVIYSVIFVLILKIVSSNELSTDIMMFAAFVYFALGAFLYKFLTKDYILNFKDNIIRPLIKAIDKDLNYFSDTHIPQRHFINSKIFTSKPDRISGNDYVSGKIDGINIEFSDIHAEKRYKDSKGKEHWSTMFQGLFIVSEFNKHFHGKTVVLPDSAQSTFGDLIGSWLQSNNLSRDELVKMDDTEFEKEFVVYSSDQIEARYILSHSLMKKLLDFKQKSAHPIYVSFVGGSIHIAISYNKDLFEPSVFNSLLDYKIAMEYVKTLHLAISVVEELKLNQRLWSKL